MVSYTLLFAFSVAFLCYQNRPVLTQWWRETDFIKERESSLDTINGYTVPNI